MWCWVAGLLGGLVRGGLAGSWLLPGWFADWVPGLLCWPVAVSPGGWGANTCRLGIQWGRALQELWLLWGDVQSIFRELLEAVGDPSGPWWFGRSHPK